MQLADQSGNSVTITTAQLADRRAAEQLPPDRRRRRLRAGADRLRRNPPSDRHQRGAGRTSTSISRSPTTSPGSIPRPRVVIVHGPGGRADASRRAGRLGTPRDGNYHAPPSRSRATRRRATGRSSCLLVDTAANESFLDTPTLIGNGYLGGFTQTGAGDTAAPLLTAFGRTPAQINTAELDQNVNFTLSGHRRPLGRRSGGLAGARHDPVNQPRGESPLNLARGRQRLRRRDHRSRRARRPAPGGSRSSWSTRSATARWSRPPSSRPPDSRRRSRTSRSVRHLSAPTRLGGPMTAFASPPPANRTGQGSSRSSRACPPGSSSTASGSTARWPGASSATAAAGG